MLDELLEGDLFSLEIWGVLALGIIAILLLWLFAGDTELMVLVRSFVQDLLQQLV